MAETKSVRNFQTLSADCRAICQNHYDTGVAPEAPTVWEKVLPADLRGEFVAGKSARLMNLLPDDPRLAQAIEQLRKLCHISDEEWAKYKDRILGPSGAGEIWAKRKVATFFCKPLLDQTMGVLVARKKAGSWVVAPKESEPESNQDGETAVSSEEVMPQN